MLKALRESTVKQRLFRQGKEQKPKCLDQKTCVVCNEKSLQVSFKAKEKKKRKVSSSSLKSAGKKEIETRKASQSSVRYSVGSISDLEWDNQADTESPLKEDGDEHSQFLRSASVSLNRVRRVVYFEPVTQDQKIEDLFEFENLVEDSVSGLITQEALLEENFQLQVKEVLEQIDELSDGSSEVFFESETQEVTQEVEMAQINKEKVNV